jgi:hypothetical protein
MSGVVVLQLTGRARAALPADAAVVLDWLSLGRCVPALGEVVVRAVASVAMVQRQPRLVQMADHPVALFADQRVAPHLAGRTVTIDCRPRRRLRRRGRCRLVCDLPADFSLCLSVGIPPP